jgi:hypothetical protein
MVRLPTPVAPAARVPYAEFGTWLQAVLNSVDSFGCCADGTGQALIHEAIKPAASDALASFNGKIGACFKALLAARYAGSRPVLFITEGLLISWISGRLRELCECWRRPKRNSATGQHRDHELSHGILLFNKVCLVCEPLGPRKIWTRLLESATKS